MSEENNPSFHQASGVSWFPGHMKRTSDLIKKLADKVDAVIEILDARIPISSRNPMVAKFTPHLPRLILLNKSDLAEPGKTASWERHFRKQGYAVFSLSSSSNHEGRKIRSRIEKEIRQFLPPSLLSFSAIICGSPNVGKSTFINLLIGSRKTKVGNRPGITMDKQIIRMEGAHGNPWSLIDMPGLLQTKLDPEESFHLALCGTIKEGIYDEVDLAGLCLKKIFLHPQPDKPNQPNKTSILIKHFSLTPALLHDTGGHDDTDNKEDDEMYWLNMIALRKGYILKNREVDYTMAARALIRDFRIGKLGRYTLEASYSADSTDR